MPKQYLRTGEAAAELGITRETLRAWADSGLVKPAFRVGTRGDMRWDMDQLHAQLHGGEGTVSQPGTTGPVQAPLAVAVVTSGRGVLIGRRGDGQWAFISGEIGPGESPHDAAVREVREETGLEVRAGVRIEELPRHPVTGRHTYYMHATPAGPDGIIIAVDGGELAEVRWASLGEATGLLPGMDATVREFLAQRLS